MLNEKIRFNFNHYSPDYNIRAYIPKNIMIQHIFNVKNTDQYFWMADNGDVVFRKGDDETVIQSSDAKTVFNKLLVQIEVLEEQEKEKNSFKNRMLRKIFRQ